MGIDEEYLEELLNTIDKIVDPEAVEATGTEYSGSSMEEELDSAVAEPMELEGIESGDEDVIAADYPDSVAVDEVVPEPVSEVSVADAEEFNADPVSTDIPAGLEGFDIDPEDGNKVLSPEEINAMFAAVNATAEETVSDEPEVEEIQSDNILDDLLMAGNEVSEVELGDVDVDDTMSMSAEEIDAMLDAAKASDDDVSLVPDSDEDLMALLAGSGDEDLSDIQSLLNSDENGEAVDEDAFMQAMNVEDVAADVLEEEDGKKKKKAKKAKKPKKSRRKKGDAEGDELDELASIPDKDAGVKKGFFARLLDLLTEPVDDEEPAVETIAIDETGAISDENRDILAELDKEKGKKKKSKKSKKDKKGKKGAEAAGSDNPDDIKEKGDDEEVVVEKKKKKKEKKPKTKKVKDETPEAPQKKLPKKRVRVTFILCLSLLVCILVGTFGFTRVLNLSDARWAFDNQDYETTYENLYGLKLGENDSKIYNTSRVLLLIDRKYQSYENYMRLGMRVEAVAALFDAVRDYPTLREKAATYGVEAQVDYTYSQIVAALSGFGISEQEAREIVAYDSKVRYTLKLQSIANGTPYTYDDEIAASSMPVQMEESPEVRTVDDILPEEGDFLPDDPNSIFDTMDNAYDMNNDVYVENVEEPREIDAEVEINW